MKTYNIPSLPLSFESELETKQILKQLVNSRSALAELKGASRIIPNEKILVQTLALQEARKSSEIENIVTTQDDLYASDRQTETFLSKEAKEVYNYSDALVNGYYAVKEKGFLSNNQIIDLFKTIENVNDGFRRIPVYLKDDNKTIVYTPPEKHDDIMNFMSNLEQFINDDELSDLDPLIKMAIIHHQFESIHPFQDGNGRSGRIINILYLVLKGFLDYPSLYLSRYINTHKQDYYRLLQNVRGGDVQVWQEWTMFILKGVEETSLETVKMIHDIKDLMQSTKDRIKTECLNIYSQDLINALFSHPYTKIKYIQNSLNVSRPTATSYLEQLVKIEVLYKLHIGRENYYLNNDLITLLMHGKK